MRSLEAHAPFAIRFPAYLAERFPVGVHAPLIALFFFAAAKVSIALGGNGQVRWAGAAVLLLAFFHLRVFDERKDAAEDLREHPERLLSRGIIQLTELERAGLVAIVLQALLAAWLGPVAFVAWAGVLAFTLLMRVEFGAGRYLRTRPFAYALTHNPVLALMALFAAATTGAPGDARFLWFVLAVSAAGLAMELGRKFPRYAARGTPAGAIVWALAAMAVASVALAFTLAALPGGVLPIRVALLAALPSAVSLVVLGLLRANRARAAEHATSLFLLLLLGVAAAAASGVLR